MHSSCVLAFEGKYYVSEVLSLIGLGGTDVCFLRLWHTDWFLLPETSHC